MKAPGSEFTSQINIQVQNEAVSLDKTRNVYSVSLLIHRQTIHNKVFSKFVSLRRPEAG